MTCGTPLVWVRWLPKEVPYSGPAWLAPENERAGCEARSDVASKGACAAREGEEEREGPALGAAECGLVAYPLALRLCDWDIYEPNGI